MFTSLTHKSRFLLSFLILVLALSLQSCYSVRVVNRYGTPDPKPNDLKGYYRDKNVQEIKKTVKLNITESDAMSIEPCSEGGFHSVEYRVSFGMVLLNFITFGRVKKIKVKYVCLKEQ